MSEQVHLHDDAPGETGRLWDPDAEVSFVEPERLLAAGDKIAAVRSVQELLKLDLMAANAAVEYYQEHGFWHAELHEPERPREELGGHTHGGPEAIKSLLRENKKIQAIKLYREETGAGLAESKEAVEKMEREL